MKKLISTFVYNNIEILQNSISIENFPAGVKKIYLSPRATMHFLKTLLEEMCAKNFLLKKERQYEILTLLDTPIVRNQIIIKVADSLIVEEKALCDFLEKELEKHFPA